MRSETCGKGARSLWEKLLTGFLKGNKTCEVLMGSDGVFDNLFLDEIVDLANNMLPPRQGRHPAASLHALSPLDARRKTAQNRLLEAI